MSKCGCCKPSSSFKLCKDERLCKLTAADADFGKVTADSLTVTDIIAENLTVEDITATNIETDNLIVNDSLELGTEQTVTLQVALDGQTSTIVSPQNANPFHGWWAAETTGWMGAFGDGQTNFSEDVDAIIFIDTTQDPIVITSMGGVGRHFRAPQPADVATGITYTQINDTTLVNTLVFDLTPFTTAYQRITLQDDGNLLVTADSGTQTELGVDCPTFMADFMTTMVYKRRSINDLPAPFPRYDELDYLPTDYTRPTQLARYIFDRMIYNGPLKAPGTNNDFIGFYAAEAKFNEYLTTGVTHTSTITKIRTTKNASTVSQIYCDQFPFATPGATVTAAGFGGGWAGANGVYVNGVTVHAYGGVTNPSDTHVDFGVGGTYHSAFYLNLDSAALPQFAAGAGYPNNADGVALPVHWGGGAATISVTHRITDDMEYPAFIAAMVALTYELYRVIVHTGLSCWVIPPNGRYPATSWAALKASLAAGTAVRRVFRTRTNRTVPSGLPYQNVAVQIPWSSSSMFNTTPTYPWTFNDPYGFLPTVASTYNYWIDAQNYMNNTPGSEVRNLYYTLDGAPTKPIHSLAGLLGYLNLSQTAAGGSHFIGTTAPMNFANPSAGNPNPNIWTLAGSFEDPSDAFSVSSLNFGFIKPALTPGKKVGFIVLENCVRADPFSFMFSIDFVRPQDQDSPRFGLESFCLVFSEMMKYLLNNHPSGAGLDSIIIDARANRGGFISMVQSFASFFGENRHSYDGSAAVWRDNGNHAIESIASLGYETTNNLLAATDQQAAFIYADETAARYGADSVFKGGNVVFLDNHVAASAGDILPVIGFLGENYDRQLGGATPVTLLGDIDGRNMGATYLAWNPCLPLQKYSERLYDAAGEPQCGIQRMRLDIPNNLDGTYNGRHFSLQDAVTAVDQAPTLLGGTGNFPLPGDLEQTVYVDIGFITPHPDPPLPGWAVGIPVGQPDPLIQNTWRDRWLEQCILAAI